MTDVAAVVAAASGSRGIGFQGNLVSIKFIYKRWCMSQCFCNDGAPHLILILYGYMYVPRIEPTN